MSLKTRLDMSVIMDGDGTEEAKKKVELIEGLTNLALKRDAGDLIECLDDGFVCLVDTMGDDAAIVQAARVSYGKGTKTVSTDRGLIRTLMRNWHTSPFEQVELKFLVRVPMDCWRQWIRHRTANVNEYSTRYSEAIDSQQRTNPHEWRLQATNNKQGSGDFLGKMWPKISFNPSRRITNFALKSKEAGMSPGEFLSNVEDEFQDHARELYDLRVEMGMAREQARKDLPLSTYTEAYWKIDLHNLFNFLRLRMDHHAQIEIRTFANAIGKLVERVCPIAYEAFIDYRFESMQLSRPEIAALSTLVGGTILKGFKEVCKTSGLSDREVAELSDKLKRMSITTDPIGT